MKPGEIYLVKFPFSDLSSSKLRPGLVISANKHNQKTASALFMALTSNLTLDYSVIISDKDLKKGTLFGDESAVHYNSIFKADKSIIGKKLMALREDVYSRVMKKFVDEVIAR